MSAPKRNVPHQKLPLTTWQVIWDVIGGGTFLLLALSVLGRRSNYAAAETDDTGCKPMTYSETSRDGASMDHADVLGGYESIDKISKITVNTGSFWLNTVVTELRITYTMNTLADTSRQESREIKVGNGGRLTATINFDDDVYLESVFMRTGDYVDWIKFCRTDGQCFGPYGGETNQGANRSYRKDRSIIKALKTRGSSVVYRIGVHFETNGLIRYEVDPDSLQTSEVAAPLIREEQRFTSPDSVFIVSNFGGTAPVEGERSFTEEVSTTETTTISSTTEAGISTKFTAGTGGITKIFVDSSVSVEVGLSFSHTFEISREETITREFTVMTPVNALPHTSVTATAYYKSVDYEYEYTGPITCLYSFSPESIDEGGFISGSFKGIQPLYETEIRYTTEYEFAPTASPTTLPTSSSIAPTLSPIQDIVPGSADDDRSDNLSFATDSDQEAKSSAMRSECIFVNCSSQRAVVISLVLPCVLLVVVFVAGDLV